MSIIDPIKQILFNAVAGGAITLVVGGLGANLVQVLYRQTLSNTLSNPSAITCSKVILVTLPIWYLYKKYAESYTKSFSFNPASFELIFFASTLGVLKYTKAHVTPILSLALALTGLSWKVFSATRTGSQLVGLIA